MCAAGDAVSRKSVRLNNACAHSFTGPDRMDLLSSGAVADGSPDQFNRTRRLQAYSVLIV